MPAAFQPVAVTIVPISLLIGTIAVHELDGTAPRVLLKPFAVRLGAWSFCFYLVHQFVLATAVTMITRRHGDALGVLVAADVIAFVASIAAAATCTIWSSSPSSDSYAGRPQAPSRGPEPQIENAGSERREAFGVRLSQRRCIGADVVENQAMVRRIQ